METQTEQHSIKVPEQIRGTAILTCVNHPTYRWVKTKYGPGYGGRGVLMFRGDSEGNPGSPFNITEKDLESYPVEERARFLQHWSPECNCAASDLIFLRWA